MELPDWIVLVVYLLGTVGIGVFVGKLVKNTSDLFVAGRQSPWWMSGLSGFMTMFSANTFVVWGAVAYEHGLVAVMINLCYGIAAIGVGFTVASRWNKLSIRTPAEYVELRFGRPTLYFYICFMMVFRMVAAGGALYAIALLTLSVLSSGNGSEASLVPVSVLNVTILIFAAIIIVYTLIGGLWAVLMTDTLQFIVLMVAVLLVIPLLVAEVGDYSTIIDQAPAGFFNPVSAQYSWLFLLGWLLIHYFMIGADWAFVQRHICVKSPADARKSAFLFGGLYLVSPFLWLLPPLLWRIENPIPPGASEEAARQYAESAYILSCESVLPSGLVGLLIAALFSATASMISSQLNVFSAVLTNDIYRPLCKAPKDENHLLLAGRVFTVVLGIVMLGIALLTPVLGGAASLIIGVTELMVVPLLAPSLAALVFRGIDTRAVWASVGISFPVGLIGKFTSLLDGTWFSNSTVSGVFLPGIITLIFVLVNRNGTLKPGLEERQMVEDHEETAGSLQQVRLPLYIVAACLVFCALTLFFLIPVNPDNVLVLSSGGMVAGLISVSILLILRFKSRAYPKKGPLESGP